MSWQRCPVCEGRGNVPQGFYARQPTLPTTVPLTEPCRRCDGTGTILDGQTVPPPLGLTLFPESWKPPETGDPIPPLPWTHDYAEPVP